MPIAWIHLRKSPFKQQLFAKYQAAHDAGQPVWAPGRSKPAREKLIDEICANIREALLGKAPTGSSAATAHPRGLRIHPGNFPRTSGHLVGRDDLLRRLDAAWDDSAVNVVSLIAAGGVGKSALLARWFDHLAAQQYRGAERVFVWSFYGQGTTHQTSSDAFLEQAIKWFDPTAVLPQTSLERGKLLAQLVRRHKTLLILDGLEPLQSPVGYGEHGSIRDPGLAALLTSLASENPGLCVLTSRFPVADLAQFRTTAPVVLVPALTDPDGAELLRVLQVIGSDRELEDLARRCSGHALSLELLGRFLWNACGGDVCQAHEFFQGHEPVSENLLSGPARRVMESYVQWFDRDHDGPSVESRLLQLLGLFDRPCAQARSRPSARRQLRTCPTGCKCSRPCKCGSPSPGSPMPGLSCCRTISPRPPRTAATSRSTPIRSSATISPRSSASCIPTRGAGHNVLFEHISRHSEEQPKTAAELAPLYAAVHHGCQAGQHEDAFNTVYWPRIHQRSEGRAHRWVGSNAAEVAMIAEFFTQRWTTPVDGLSDATRAAVLGIASSRLRAEGDFRQALRLAKSSFENYYRSWCDSTGPEAAAEGSDALRNQKHLSVRMRHQAELLTLLGELDKAVQAGRQSLQHAEASQDQYTLVMSHSVLGWIARQHGRLPDALASFAQAEAIFQQIGLPRRELYSLWGFRYGEALLEHGAWDEVRRRAVQSIAWAEADLAAGGQPDSQFSLGLLDLPLALLSLVAADCAAAESTGRRPLPDGAAHLERRGCDSK